MSHPIPAVMAVVVHAESVLLVQRRHPPNSGRWGFPGGKIEWGETLLQAAERELWEETGVLAQAEQVITTYDSLSPEPQPTYHYVLVAVQCRWLSGVGEARSDAADVCWLPISELASTQLDLIDGVADILQLMN